MENVMLNLFNAKRRPCDDLNFSKSPPLVKILKLLGWQTCTRINIFSRDPYANGAIKTKFTGLFINLAFEKVVEVNLLLDRRIKLYECPGD